MTDSPGNLFDPGFCHVSKSKVICLSEWSRRGVSVGENICYSLSWMDFILSSGLENPGGGKQSKYSDNECGL